MAKLCQSLGLTVIAGCFSKTSTGAQILGQLKQEDNKRAIHVQELDITLPESIARLQSSVNEILRSSRGEFYALVNNAGFMTFGEFEWLTPELIRRQLEVNLLGTMNVTQSLLPLLRQSSQQRNNNQGSRIINVTSHCGIMALPGLSVYAASKAGLSFYTNALRMELQQYNIQVVNFVPGSFVGQSGIALRQEEFAKEMWENLEDEQREFYEEYFHRYNNYLSAAFREIPKDAAGIVDSKILKAFEKAISAKEPRRRYLVEPLRYKIYHNLAKVLPDSRLRDELVYKFTMMPRYEVRK